MKLSLFVASAVFALSAQAQTTTQPAQQPAPAPATNTAAAVTAPAPEQKKFSMDVTTLSVTSNQASFLEAQSTTDGYVALKYKLDAKSRLAARQYFKYTARGVDSKPTTSSAGKMNNLMLIYGRNIGPVMGSEDADMQLRLTLPVFDASGYNIGSTRALFVIPWKINPKWSVEYVLGPGLSLDTNTSKMVANLHYNYGQLTYSITDKVSVYQALGLQTGNLGYADKFALYLETGVSASPAKWLNLIFAVGQEQKLGHEAEPNFVLYGGGNSSFALTTQVIF